MSTIQSRGFSQSGWRKTQKTNAKIPMKLFLHYPLALNRALNFRNGQKRLCRSWCRSAKSIHFLVAGFRDRRSLGSFASFWPNTDLHCKTVRIFAFSSTCEQSNKGLEVWRLKTESETEERR